MKKIFNKILKIVKHSTKIYYNRSYYEREDKHKFNNDDVTNCDINTQKYLQMQFLKLLPNSTFIGEEGVINKLGEYTWIVDPIDGTFNYKHDVKIYGTQVALLKNGKTIFSCLYLPEHKQMFYACDKGAFLNGKQIFVSSEQELKNMAVNIGDFQLNYKQTLNTQKQIMLELCDKVKRIRMFGSSCYDSCQIANWCMDVYIVYILNKWDLVPGNFLIRQAGGVLFTNINKNIFIYGNKQNVEKVIKKLNNIDTFYERDLEF